MLGTTSPGNGSALQPPVSTGQSPAEDLPRSLGPEVLTRRETEVLKLMADGHSSKQVAKQLGITFKTAVTHRSRILTKLGVHETVSAVRWAIRVKIIEP